MDPGRLTGVIAPQRMLLLRGLSALAIGSRLTKILAWYDNERGFSNRLIDLALLMDKQGL